MHHSQTPTFVKTLSFMISLLIAFSASSSDGNPYVNCSVTPGSVTETGLDFHVDPKSLPAIVTLSANSPYLLEQPNSGAQINLVSHGIPASIDWRVSCEDNEWGKSRYASGTVSACNYRLVSSYPEHRDPPPNIIRPNIVGSIVDSPSGNPSIAVSIGFQVKQGCHRIHYLYEPCSCGFAPNSFEDVPVTFDTFHWTVSFCNPNKDIEVPPGTTTSFQFVRMLDRDYAGISASVNASNSKCALGLCHGTFTLSTQITR